MLIALTTLIVSFAVPTAFAAGGASSNYFPGAYGDGEDGYNATKFIHQVK